MAPNQTSNNTPKKTSEVCSDFRYKGKCASGEQCKLIHLERTRLPKTTHYDNVSPMDVFFSQFPNSGYCDCEIEIDYCECDARHRDCRCECPEKYPECEWGNHAGLAGRFRLMHRMHGAEWSARDKLAVEEDFKDALVETFNWLMDRQEGWAWVQLATWVDGGDDHWQLGDPEAKKILKNSWFDLFSIVERDYEENDPSVSFPNKQAKMKAIGQRGMTFPHNHPLAGEHLRELEDLIWNPNYAVTEKAGPKKVKIHRDGGVSWSRT